MRRPSGIAQAPDFAIKETTVRPIAEGEILVRNHYLSVDPAMRGWIADTGNYSTPVAIGDVMRSLATGTIVESRHADYQAGDYVTGWFGWQDYALITPDQVTQRTTSAECRQSLGILGMNGITAYLALTDIGAPKPRETVVVSTAAGAVGATVGQIAKIMGCRTIGIAGGAQKAALCLAQFGYDAAVDYRVEDVGSRIAALCPDGVDVYFDNVSGPISDAVMPHLALRARVVVCGTASVASWDEWPTGP